MKQQSDMEGEALAFPLTKPIILVGLMGAGKSTIGRRLAKVLELEFIDADNEIVEAAGCSIADIFEVHGEEIFRDLERRIIRNLVERTPCIIATGGGAFIDAQNRALIQERAISVWLKAELDVLVERVSRKSNRPILEQGDKREILKRLMDQRYPVYAEAHLAVDSDSGLHEMVVSRIIATLNDHMRNNAHA